MDLRCWNLGSMLAFAAAVVTPAFGQPVAPAVGAAIGGSGSAESVPDFSGIWAHPSIPGFEPLASGPTSLVNLSRREGNVSNNRQLVGDYTNPILKPEAAEIVKRFGEISKSGVTFPSTRNQCWPGPIPFILSIARMQMFQRPDRITMLYSTDHQVRHIRMNEAHPADVTPSWYGDSVGHYEGDTLVIDTVGIKLGPYPMVDWYGTPFTPALHVVERYRLIDYEDAKEGLERDARENFRPQPEPIDRGYRGKHLQLLFTVEDRGVFTTPWSATLTYRRPSGAWPEDVCSENPYRYGTEEDAKIPFADKPDF